MSEQNHRSFSLRNLVSPHYLAHKKQHFVQCLLATFVVLILLLTLDFISNNLVISSIASTTFIIFTCPHYKLSSTRYILGGYFVGVVVGILCYYLLLDRATLLGGLTGLHLEVVGAIAVGASIFFMTVFNLEHPPAAAVSLAIVALPWTLPALLLTLAFVVFLCLTRRLLKKYFINLI